MKSSGKLRAVGRSLPLTSPARRGTIGRMQLKPGHYSPPRDAEQIQEIKAAVRAGKSFRQFWLDTAAMWPSHAHLPPLHTAPSKGGRGTADPVLRSPEWRRLLGLFTYYAYRVNGDARYVNATEATPFSYTDTQRMLAARSAATGMKFAQFWSMYAHGWNKPMYRLRNWYRGYQKTWRDMATVTPSMTEADKALAVSALGSRYANRRPVELPLMVSVRAVPEMARRETMKYLRRTLGVSFDLAQSVLAGKRFLPCVRRPVEDVITKLRSLGVDCGAVRA